MIWTCKEFCCTINHVSHIHYIMEYLAELLFSHSDFSFTPLSTNVIFYSFTNISAKFICTYREKLDDNRYWISSSTPWSLHRRFQHGRSIRNKQRNNKKHGMANKGLKKKPDANPCWENSSQFVLKEHKGSFCRANWSYTWTINVHNIRIRTKKE